MKKVKVVNVLIVDNSEFMAACVRKIVSRYFPATTISIALNGAEAVQKARKEVFDLVLMDISMPGMNGIEVTRYFSANHAGTVVLAMSVNDEKECVNQALDAGARGYLLKTSLLDDMGAAINFVMEGRFPYMSSGLFGVNAGMPEGSRLSA